jgi:hypothetical protein
MLNRVHEQEGFRTPSCHPEPRPELDSGSIDFAISVLGLENLNFEAPSCEQGSLFGWFHLFRLRLADTEIGELDLRFLGKLRGS